MKTHTIAVILAVGLFAVLSAGFATPLLAQVVPLVYPLSNGKITKRLKAANGVLPNFDVRNEMTIKATDIHFKITKPAGYRIKQVETSGDFTNHWPEPPDAPNAEGGADGGVGVNPSTEASPQQVSVKLHVVDGQGNPADNVNVEFTIQWSNMGDLCAMVSPTELGGPSGVLLASVIPEYNASPVSVLVGTETLTCNDIAIGEVFGYRFESGSLVVKPSSGRFELQPDTAIRGYNQDGDDVSGTGAFSVSNIRINDRGYLVFDVSRDRTDEQHVAIVIRGLKLTQLHLDEHPRDIQVSLTGAALSGESTDDPIHIATVQEEE